MLDSEARHDVTRGEATVSDSASEGVTVTHCVLHGQGSLAIHIRWMQCSHCGDAIIAARGIVQYFHHPRFVVTL